MKISQQKKIRAKQRARQLAVQALYQWHLAKQPMSDVEAQFLAIHNMDKVDKVYFSELIHGIEKHCEELDMSFGPFLDRKIHALNPVELSILRLGSYELKFSPSIPFRIILEEAILLTKAFGAQNGFRYVNGVLNQLAKTIRTSEI